MNETGLANAQSLDIFRDSCLRYLGYFGLLGRICAPFIPGNYLKTVAMTYIVSDVAQKSLKTVDDGASKCRLFVNGSDAIIWQTASSVLIPGLLVKSFSELAQKFQAYRNIGFIRSLSEQAWKFKVFRKMTTFRSWPYYLSAVLMPFLSRPMDKSVNFLMDGLYRKWFKNDLEICKDLFGTAERSIFDAPKRSRNFSDFDRIYEEIKSKKKP